MSPIEYVQMKAFARIDGLLLAVLWVFSFVCYVVGLSNPLLSVLAMLLAVSTPFVVAKRLRKFRDVALQGSISLMRGWAFVVFVFFYGSILFALVLYAYFAYIDHGYVIQNLLQMLNAPETAEVISQYGLSESMNISLEQLQSMRPIDLSLNILTSNIMLGIILGFPIGLMMRKDMSTK